MGRGSVIAEDILYGAFSARSLVGSNPIRKSLRLGSRQAAVLELIRKIEADELTEKHGWITRLSLSLVWSKPVVLLSDVYLR